MDNFMIAFIILMLTLFVSRMVNEKANKKLDQNKKAELIDVFSKGRVYTFGALIIIIALFFISLRFNLINPLSSYILYIILILAFLIITGFRSYKVLKSNGFPDAYIKSYLISTAIRFIGLVLFFAVLEFK
jgi:VIT1/CCC1 family predicted Fe2+/Mn2+ transporter